MRDCALMPSEIAMAVIKGERMAIMQRQTTIVFVLCRNKFSVAKRSKLMCLFNYFNLRYYFNVQEFQCCCRSEAFAVQNIRLLSNLISANASPLRVTANKVTEGLI